jgi:hypothetical protein
VIARRTLDARAGGKCQEAGNHPICIQMELQFLIHRTSMFIVGSNIVAGPPVRYWSCEKTAAYHAHVAHGHHLHATHHAEEAAKYVVIVVPEGTFAGTQEKPVLVKDGDPIPADTGDQGGGQN